MSSNACSAITNADDVVSPQPDDAFHVNDDQSANWVVKKITEARAYSRRVEGWAAAEIRRAEREEQFFVTRYGGELEAWARKQIEKRGHKCKSICLPAGTVGFRVEPSKLAVSDETRLRAWCRKHLPTAVKVTERVLTSAVREHISATGEQPEGCDLRGGGQRFYVK